MSPAALTHNRSSRKEGEEDGEDVDNRLLACVLGNGFMWQFAVGMRIAYGS